MPVSDGKLWKFWNCGVDAMIYLDNAATTRLKPQSVIDAVVKAMTTMGNASRGAHGSALEASRAVYNTRYKLAKLFGCKRPDHVVFTCNSTEALNIAIRGVLNSGDHVISTDLEHNSVLRPLYLLESEGIISLDFVSADPQGRPRMDEFESLIRPNTRVIVCTHASNLTGEIVDLYEVGRIAKQHGVMLIVDASQTAGCVPIDMDAMNIDILCFTGHKGIYGPQGTGGLCIREGVEIRPFKVGGSGIHSYMKFQPEEYPTRLEAGTLNSHGLMGLSAALDFLEEIGVERCRSTGRIDQLYLPYYRKALQDGVSIDGIKEMFRYFFLRFQAAGRFADQPFTICGVTEDGSDATTKDKLTQKWIELINRLEKDKLVKALQ